MFPNHKRHVDAGHERRLPGGALWHPGDAQAGIGRNEYRSCPVDTRQVFVPSFAAGQGSEGRKVCGEEWIAVGVVFAQPDPVQEKEKDAHE